MPTRCRYPFDSVPISDRMRSLSQQRSATRAMAFCRASRAMPRPRADAAVDGLQIHLLAIAFSQVIQDLFAED